MLELGNAIDKVADRALGAARSFGRDHLDDDAGASHRVGPPPGTVPDPAMPAMIWIRYENSDGALSERTLTLRQAWREGGDIHIIAWCHMQKRALAFDASRIRELVCLATGEHSGDPAAWLEQNALLVEGGKNDDDTIRALRAVRDELALLAFLARADGYLARDEIEVAIEHVASSAETPINRLECAAYIRRLAPDPEDLPAVLERVTADGARWERLRTSALRLAMADGAVSKNEEAAWKQIGDEGAAAAARKAEFVSMIGRSGLAGAFEA